GEGIRTPDPNLGQWASLGIALSTSRRKRALESPVSNLSSRLFGFVHAWPAFRRHRVLRAPATTSPLRRMSILAVGEGTLRADKCPETVVHGVGAARKIRKMAINQRKLSIGLVCA